MKTCSGVLLEGAVTVRACCSDAGGIVYVLSCLVHRCRAWFGPVVGGDELGAAGGVRAGVEERAFRVIVSRVEVDEVEDSGMTEDSRLPAVNTPAMPRRERTIFA